LSPANPQATEWLYRVELPGGRCVAIRDTELRGVQGVCDFDGPFPLLLILESGEYHTLDPASNGRTWMGVLQGAPFSSLAGQGPGSAVAAGVGFWSFQRPFQVWRELRPVGF